MLATACLAALIAAAPLDSRAATRAIELAFENELAGDPEGAREALEARLAASSGREEAVGRAMIERWVSKMGVRARGFASGASREDAAEAWEGMAEATVTLRERAWRHLMGQDPGLARRVEPIRVELDRTAGLPPAELRGAVEKALGARGVELGPQGLELAVRLELERPKRSGGWSEVRAELGSVLTSTGTDKAQVVALFSRTRTERRRNPDAARRFVLRRLSLDAAEAVRFALRRRALAP